MARLRTDRKKYKHSKPWKAEVKIDYYPFFLGYFETKEEAEQVERQFRQDTIGQSESSNKTFLSRR